jgi:hypothetical protein
VEMLPDNLLNKDQSWEYRENEVRLTRLWRLWKPDNTKTSLSTSQGNCSEPKIFGWPFGSATTPWSGSNDPNNLSVAFESTLHSYHVGGYNTWSTVLTDSPEETEKSPKSVQVQQ